MHLRGGKVARGGLRWSDRREDFRTEILGLMKAQMVKNALIVPVGSKGGFVVKRPPPEGGREAAAGARNRLLPDVSVRAAGSHRQHRRAARSSVLQQTVRYDDDDPYLVVAADKGTASFSDIANEVAARYGFWLGDAFASGGSHGYDHKAMGITARGAWESVKRHFRELGTDIAQSDFTVGRHRRHVRRRVRQRHAAVAAHQADRRVQPRACVLGPGPDPQVSFAERRRLFELGRSGWNDYDTSSDLRGRRHLPPQREGDQALRSSPAGAVDRGRSSCLRTSSSVSCCGRRWNCCGTVASARTSRPPSETHAAGRRQGQRRGARSTGASFAAGWWAKAGISGFTQRGRIEYALAGGKINTDAIDNVAGVNCSDHEVNIKILLDSLVAGGELTRTQRNDLLSEMTDAVAEQVLYASYIQTQAMSMALYQAPGMLDVHARLIRHLEQVAGLQPGDRVPSRRRGAGAAERSTTPG